MTDYTKYNAQNVLDNVNQLIDRRDKGAANKYSGLWYYGNRGYDMRKVCDDLSIFDWWVDNLSVSKLKDMRQFIEEAIKLGYTGYVCFKVGAAGCANGMWAYKTETTDGYSPNGECLYKSFTPSYNYWDAQLADGSWLAETTCGSYDGIKTKRQLESLLAK